MSKMLRLLNKAEMLKGGSSVLVSHSSLTARPGGHEKYQSAHSTDDAQENSYNHTQGDIQYGQTTKFYILGIVAALMMASFSIFLSYKLLSDLNMSKEISFQMLSDYQIQNDKIVMLEKSILKLEKERLVYHRESQEKISQLSTNIEQNKIDMSNLKASQNNFQEKLDDFKATNRLLFNKTISLNDEIKKLQNQLQEEGRNL